MVLGLLLQDYLLALICLVIAIVSAIGYFHSDRYKTNFGVHLILCIYLIGFTFAAFTNLYALPLILVYPVVIILAQIFFTSDRILLSYVIISILCCIIAISVNKYKHDFFVDDSYYIAAIIISVILLGCLASVSKSHTSVLRKYQKKLQNNESAITEKNQILENYIESNLQLENFAHLASHELKTPMRNISNFSGLLEMKLGKNLNEDTKEVVGIIKSEVSRMDKLIGDLLKLTLASNENIEFKQILLKPFLNEFIDRNFSAYKSNISIKEVPNTIIANDIYLNQLLSNLISNSIKFQGTNDGFELIIRGFESDQFYNIEIHDNGIGIKDELKKNIFLIFKRLHTQMEYEGTGIGLAICKKIVERHSGEIWVEDSTLLSGCVFKFTINKALKNVSI